MSNFVDLPKSFNSGVYKYFNKDLSGMNDDELKVHYLNHGKSENRIYELSKEFDIDAYREYNSDLSNFSDYDLIQHFINHGINENRIHKYSNTTPKKNIITVPPVLPVLPTSIVTPVVNYQQTSNVKSRNNFIFVII